MIESARRHGPFDPRFRATTNGHRRSVVEAKRLEAKRLEKKRLEKARSDAAGWAALQAWEEEGGATQ
jgi:hypothetical protein